MTIGKIKASSAFAIILLGGSSEVLALDMEYYTYHGFDVVVPAFERMALIFTTDNYLGLFISFAVLGVLFAGVAATIRGFVGQPVSVQSWTLPILIGVVVYQALMFPKASVAVYDPVKNQSKVIGDVPQAIVLVAGLFNLVERSVIDAIDIASATPYKDEARGLMYQVMHAAANRRIDVDDSFVSRTLSTYIERCALLGMNATSSGVDSHFIKRGTNDLMEVMEAVALPAFTTVVYNPTNKTGFVTDCKTAWESHLAAALTDTRFENAEKDLCAASGFDVAVVAQIERCRERMQGAMTLFGVPEGSFSSAHFVRNMYFAQRFASVIKADPSGATLMLGNRNTIVQGLGMRTIAEDWLPQIRGVMTGLALAMVPIVALFLVTPLASRAVFFTLGLFGWLTLWGAMDALLNDMVMSTAAAYWESIRAVGFALDGMYMAPEASQKALALLGKTETYSITLASVIAMAIWRFGGYAFTQLSENWSSHLESVGAQAAMATQTVEGSARSLSEMTDSMATHALHSQASGAALAAMRSGAQLGQLGGARQVSGSLGRDPMSNTDLMNTAKDISHNREAIRGAGTLAQSRAFESSVGSATEGAALTQEVETLKRVGEARTTENMVDHLQALQPQQNTAKAYESLAAYGQAETLSNLLASSGNVGSYLSTLANDKSISLAQKNALVQTGLDMGLSPQQIGDTYGRYSAAQASGKQQTLDQLSTDEVAFGYYVNFARHGMTAEALNSMAQARDMSLEQFMHSSAGIEAAQSMARLEKLESVSELASMSVPDVIRSQEGAHTTLSASGESLRTLADQFQESQLIEAYQHQLLTDFADSGQVAHVSFSTDLTKADDPAYGNVSIHSGARVSQDDSTRLTSETSVTSGIRTDSSVWTALTDPTQTPQSQTIVQRLFDDFDRDGTLNDQASIDLISTLDQQMNSFARSSVSDYDSSSLSGTLHAGAGVSKSFQPSLLGLHPAGRLLSKVLPKSEDAFTIGGEAGLKGNMTGSTGSQENISASNFATQTRQFMEQTLKHIQTTDPDMLSPERHVQFVSHLGPFIHQYANEMRRVAEHNAQDSDQSEILEQAEKLMEKGSQLKDQYLSKLPLE